MTRRTVLLGFGLLALAASVLAANGCAHAPRTGDACQAQDAFCAGPGAAYACRDGRLAPFACLGPKGCTLGAGRAVMCDQSKAAAAGLFCFPEYEGKGQCAAAEPGAYLQCLNGAWVKNLCSEGRACHEGGGELVCK